MDLYIKAEPSECDQFIEKPGGKKELVKVQIVPLRVSGVEGNLKVVMGCNLWEACHYKGCFYSKEARDKTARIESKD